MKSRRTRILPQNYMVIRIECLIQVNCNLLEERRELWIRDASTHPILKVGIRRIFQYLSNNLKCPTWGFTALTFTTTLCLISKSVENIDPKCFLKTGRVFNGALYVHFLPGNSSIYFGFQLNQFSINSTLWQKGSHFFRQFILRNLPFLPTSSRGKLHCLER
uniref:Uncharacterized protein n=1 Tax=Opuntia streptacantha TaxID=393608 RepID=A0A7C9E6X8_OPUST